MLIKYLDLHNKILRDAAEPAQVAENLIKNGYYVVGVNSHNEGDEVKNKEHYYKFFETHFEIFEKKGLLMLPAVEIKIRDGNYDNLPRLIDEFSRKFIPIHHKKEIHHVPFLIFVHGGMEKANLHTTSNPHADILCHPEKDEGIFTQDMADLASKNDVGIEINYREYTKSSDKTNHKNKVLGTIKKVKKAKGKLFLFSASIREEEELVHIKELVEYGKSLHENLVAESINNVHDLIQLKYGKLLAKTHYSLEQFMTKHKN